MSFDGQEVCIRDWIADADGRLPSVLTWLGDGPSAPPAILQPRAGEGDVQRFQLVALGAIEDNRFMLTTELEEFGERKRFLLFDTRGWRATPGYVDTLRVCARFEGVQLSSLDPEDPDLEGLIWTIIDADPRHLRLPVKIRCVSNPDGSLRLQDDPKETPLSISLWPLPVSFDWDVEQKLLSQEMIELSQLNAGLRNLVTTLPRGADTARSEFQPEFDENLSALEMIEEQYLGLRNGISGLASASGRSGLFQPSQTRLGIDTVRLAFVMSSLIYARVPLDRDVLMRRMGLIPFGYYQNWVIGGINEVWPPKQERGRINLQLQDMLRDSMAELKRGATILGLDFQPLRLLHQNVRIDSLQDWKRYSRAGCGPFCGVFLDHENNTAVVTFKGTDFWNNSELIATNGNALLKTFIFSNGASDVTLANKGKIHSGFGNGLFKKDVIDLDWSSGTSLLGVPFDHIMQRLRQLMAHRGVYDVWVTGHSLGGAYANTFHAAFLQWCAEPSNKAKQLFIPRDLITFGSPRVGNKDFADGYDALLRQRLPGDDSDTLPSGYRRRHWRYVNATDIVPHMPPVPPLDYYHTDTGIHLHMLTDKGLGYPTRIPSERKGQSQSKEEPTPAQVSQWTSVTQDPIDELADMHSKGTKSEPPMQLKRKHIHRADVTPNFANPISWIQTCVPDHKLPAYWKALRVLNQPDDPRV